uniref:ATP synthase complex subunit 8 n=1 Tax=Hypsugo alaschanicus TaxID=999321 RepID=A0A144KZ42_9CHIR|nr:ATP synthase F0 subunit 8 [Hypsugo alaschanicus]AMT85304.1 ATP synthase F0 subunit 8 [Hypsugo alaschanicus]ATL15939.1 ATP synthase F0 subunit 8 [Hypsugo alaschanicus]QIA44629.1 ATP synthase F0 subunit 8 [Hypsugo alaschanicus]
MPQLNTSTWFITIISMIITLFIVFQLKISNYYYYTSPGPLNTKIQTHTAPWEIKWTKIYLPLLSPPH